MQEARTELFKGKKFLMVAMSQLLVMLEAFFLLRYWSMCFSSVLQHMSSRVELRRPSRLGVGKGK